MIDVVSLIKKDHRELEELFARLTAGDGDRQRLLDEITVRLEAHSRAEELEVYPVLSLADPGEEDEVEHAHHEHHEAEHRLRMARNLVVSPHFGAAFTEFVQAVKHHVEEEENEVLPALQKAVDAGRLAELGAAFEKVRGELLASPAAFPDAVTEPVASLGGKLGTVPAAAAGDLADATRDELYERAKEADIPGRSAMTKEELADALREQG
jgi:hemerythrin superfamily protein